MADAGVQTEIVRQSSVEFCATWLAVIVDDQIARDIERPYCGDG